MSDVQKQALNVAAEYYSYGTGTGRKEFIGLAIGKDIST